MRRPSTATACRSGSTRWPIVAGSPSTRHPAGGDHGLGGPTRGDAGVGQRLLEPDLRHHPLASPIRCAGRCRSVQTAHRPRRRIGPADVGEPLGRLRVERRQVVERGQAEALQELEAGAVEDRPAGRVGPALLDDEPAVEQAAHHVVRVDAADALDDAPRDRLAVGDDGQRLERGRRELEPLGAGVAGDDRARLRRRRELDAVADRAGAGCRAARSSTSRSPSRASTVSESTPARLAISRRVERPLGDEEQRFELGDRQVRLAGPGRGAAQAIDGVGVVELIGRGSAALRLERSAMAIPWSPSAQAKSASDSSIGASSSAPPARSAAVVARQVIGPHGSACSATTSRRLTSSSRARKVTAMTTRS